MTMAAIAVLFLALLHCAIGASLDEHRYTMSEVAAFDEATWKRKFEAFMANYGKEYATEDEYKKRFDAYKVHHSICATSNKHQTTSHFFVCVYK